MNCSFSYRLAPEHPFPVPLEDCEKAVKYFMGKAQSYDVDPSRVVVAGRTISTCTNFLYATKVSK